MDKELILEVKKKREFSELPDSIVFRALEITDMDIKSARALLRKYFGVFLTNKVVKGNDEQVLKIHKSSFKRDYDVLYNRIFLEDYDSCNDCGNVPKTIIDLGCGVNGFSYFYLKKIFPKASYIGVEASGQIVEITNRYFKDRGFEGAHVFCKDLFDFDFISKIVKQTKSPRFVFLFQVVDSLESFERNFSKKLLLNLKNSLDKDDKLVLSVSLKSLSGGAKKASGKWAFDFISSNFNVFDEFDMFDERFVIFGKN